jgi:hypothetical protein
MYEKNGGKGEKLVWSLLPKIHGFSNCFLSQSQPNHNPIMIPSLSIQRLQERQTCSFLPVLASTHRHQNQEMAANYWCKY